MDIAALPDIAAWQAAVTRVLKGADPATLVTHSPDGIPVAPLYGPAEPAATAWRARSTTVGIVQPVESPDPEEAARLAVLDGAGGATTLVLVFAGAPAAHGFGLPHDGFEPVLDAIDPARVSLRAEVPPGMATLDRLQAVASRTGARLEVACDPLAAAAVAGTDPASALSGWIAAAAHRDQTAPILRADGRPHHDAGATEAGELAAVLATGVEALRALERAGLGASPVGFTLAADADQLFTVAKLRALRRLWARVEQLCGRPPAAMELHVETSRRMLARRDPWSNLLRTAVACAGAILGGADSVTALPFTAAIGLPDAFARRLARNTPLVLLEEAGLGRVTDPLAGSGAIEALTEALCQEAWALFQGIEQAGGMVAALAAGVWQARLAEAQAARTEAIGSGRSTLVGVSAFKPPPDVPMPVVLRPTRVKSPPGATTDRRGLIAIRDAEPFEDELQGGEAA